jgi:organic radical activating enzyme
MFARIARTGGEPTIVDGEVIEAIKARRFEVVGADSLVSCPARPLGHIAHEAKQAAKAIARELQKVGYRSGKDDAAASPIAFNGCINARDTLGLAQLRAKNHSFIDTARPRHHRQGCLH